MKPSSVPQRDIVPFSYTVGKRGLFVTSDVGIKQYLLLYYRVAVVKSGYCENECVVCFTEFFASLLAVGLLYCGSPIEPRCGYILFVTKPIRPARLSILTAANDRRVRRAASSMVGTHFRWPCYPSQILFETK